jgi:hypothetical protein
MTMIRPSRSTTNTRRRSCGGAVTYTGWANVPTRARRTPRFAALRAGVSAAVAVAVGVGAGRAEAPPPPPDPPQPRTSAPAIATGASTRMEVDAIQRI